MPRIRLAAAALGALAFIAVPQAAFARGAITLAVDATDAPRKLLHARLVIPVEPGPLSLSYPKWIPGEHGPTGPLTDIAGLHLSASGKPVAWERDLVDMYALHCTVPADARELEVRFDFLAIAEPEGFSSAASVTEHLMLLSWNQVLLYPSGEPSDGLTYRASLTLPAGWKYGTALDVAREERGSVEFAPVSLTTLIDSPVIAGDHFRRVDLSPGQKPERSIDMACDGEAGLAMSPAEIAEYRRLVVEAEALFGAHHYRRYRFLLSLSDHVAHFGLEHHESSDDRSHERMWIDDDLRLSSTNLLPHEMVHSWNGKYRRPADLATPDYQVPMKDDLLWVYEGLTQYLGFVLGARSGVRTLDQARQNLALAAATLDQRPGRTWRPLQDTAVEAQMLYEASPHYASWRRGTDFYNEGLLIWLEADALIRTKSRGARSLDDFCRRFHGGASGPPAVVPYTFDDVVRRMNDVAPYDWRTFFTQRLESLEPHAPLGGIESSGWRLTYVDSVPPLLKAYDAADKSVDVSFSLGFDVSMETRTIGDVIPGSPAFRAGLAPGMKLVAVDGRKWTADVLHDAIRAAKSNGRPLEVIAENGEFVRSFTIDYRGGERYPRLERTAGKPDLLSQILRPLRPAGGKGL